MKQKVSEKITQLRKGAGLTQQQLADELNVSAATVSKWENGASAPDIAMLCALADRFQISMDELLCYHSRQKRAILFLYSRVGEEEARKVLEEKGYTVCGVAFTLSELIELLEQEKGVDAVVTVALTALSDYVNSKLSELRECHHFQIMTVITTNEDQIGGFLAMMLSQFSHS